MSTGTISISRAKGAVRGALVAALLASAVLLAPSRAEAKGLFIITYGDSIKDMGELPIDSQKEVTDPTLHLGYKYSYFGLFWLDLWSWGGEFCLYKDHDYAPLSVEDAARLMHKQPSEMKKPFFYRFPELLFVLVVGVGGLLLLGMFIKTPPEGQGTGAATDGAAAAGGGDGSGAAGDGAGPAGDPPAPPSGGSAA